MLRRLPRAPQPSCKGIMLTSEIFTGNYAHSRYLHWWCALPKRSMTANPMLEEKVYRIRSCCKGAGILPCCTPYSNVEQHYQRCHMDRSARRPSPANDMHKRGHSNYYLWLTSERAWCRLLKVALQTSVLHRSIRRKVAVYVHHETAPSRLTPRSRPLRPLTCCSQTASPPGGRNTSLLPQRCALPDSRRSSRCHY
jgi:hypothetical protein